MINMFRPHTKIKPLLLIAAFLLPSSLLQAQTPGVMPMPEVTICLLYTSDAADE